MDDFPNNNGNNVPNNNVNDPNNVANNTVNNPNNAVDPNMAANSDPNTMDPNLGYMYSPDMAGYYDNSGFMNSEISGFYDNTGFMNPDMNNGYDTTGFMDANPNVAMDNSGSINVDPNAGFVNPDMNGGFANVDMNNPANNMNQNVDNGFGNTGFTNPNMGGNNVAPNVPVDNMGVANADVNNGFGDTGFTNPGADNMTFDPNMAVDNTGFMNVDPNMGVNNAAPNIPVDNMGVANADVNNGFGDTGFTNPGMDNSANMTFDPNMPMDNMGGDANANFDNPIAMDPNMNNPVENSGDMNFDPIMSVDNTGFMNADPNMPINNMGGDANANFDNPIAMDPNTSIPMDNPVVMNPDMNNVGFDNAGMNNASFDQNQNMDPNYQVNNLNNNNVQNNKPKKSSKGLLTILVALIFVALIAIVGLFIFKNMNKNKNNNQVPTNTVDTSIDSITADEKGLMSIDFSTLPEDNEYLMDVDSQKDYKILKPTGTVEGLLNITDEDIYKVTIDTDNIMIFKAAKEYNADFIMLDAEGAAHEAVFSVTDKEDEYNELTATDNEDKGEEQTFNEWKYCKIKDGCVAYFPFNRRDDDFAIASFTIKGKNFKDMSDEKFAEFMETVIDCIKLERTGEFNPDDGIEYNNILSNVDMYNVPISNGIILDLATHFKVNTYTIQGYPDDSSTSVDQNSLILDSKDDRYRVTINESTTKTLADIEKDANIYHYTWESVLINDEEAFIEYKEDGKFRGLYIDRDGVVITIGVTGLGEEKNVGMEDAVNYLGENLFK